MTEIERTLYACGYTDCQTVAGKTAALRQCEGGTALRTNLRQVANGIVWHTQSTFRYDEPRSLDSAKAALRAWAEMQGEYE